LRPALLDSSAMVALFNPSERAHAHYRRLLHEQGRSLQLYTTWPCLTEAAYLLHGRDRSLMLAWVGHGGAQVYPLDCQHLPDMALLMQRYTEPGKTEMDLADASLYWVAVDGNVHTILTLDVRDFSRYRLPDGRGFELW